MLVYSFAQANWQTLASKLNFRQQVSKKWKREGRQDKVRIWGMGVHPTVYFS